MGYMEPPWTQQAPKQCLGYVQLIAGRFMDAEITYSEDLNENPENPWSIIGLAQVYTSMHRKEAADELLSKLNKSIPIQLKSSCPLLLINA